MQVRIPRPTVSKFFNDPTSVKTSTRARIEEALEQYDNRPNVYATNQNRKLTKNVGIVVPYLVDRFLLSWRAISNSVAFMQGIGRR